MTEQYLGVEMIISCEYRVYMQSMIWCCVSDDGWRLLKSWSAGLCQGNLRARRYPDNHQALSVHGAIIYSSWS